MNSVVQQRNAKEKLENECAYYENIVNELKKEVDDRDNGLENVQVLKTIQLFLKGNQREIERYQMDILYSELKIEKARNMEEELQENRVSILFFGLFCDYKQSDETLLDAQDKIDEYERIDKDVTQNFQKYIDRIFYSKKK